LGAKAGSPPPSKACFHRHTELGEAPTRRATSSIVHPLFSSATAHRRRRSNAFGDPFGLMEHVSAFLLHYFCETQ
jgi:hypothetical protein